MKILRSMTLVSLMVITFVVNANAEITEVKLSEDFGTYKYEMDIKPSSEDIEPNSIIDFTETLSGTGGFALNGDGTLKYTSLVADTAYYNSNTSGGAWRTLAPTLASGYTIEIRLRVNSQYDDTFGAIYITSAPSDSNSDTLLRIGTDFVKWGSTDLTTLISGVSNSDAFHTFRIAMEEGQTLGSEKITVWRDGILLSSTLEDVLPFHNNLNRLQFGDATGNNTGGDVDIDYVRFTKGAYAPAAPVMGEKDSSDFGIYKYEMDSKPSTQDLDSNSFLDFDEGVLNDGSVTLNGDGTLKLATLTADQANYKSDSIYKAWRTLVPTLLTGYTVEIRLRVNSQTDNTYGAINISSVASDSDADSVLRIGTDFVKWGNTTLTTLQSGMSNSDGFHIFRLAMIGGQEAGSEKFTVWRDGVLLSSTLTDALPHTGLDRVLFGDTTASNTGGDVDVDYFRFIKGAYAPVTPPIPPAGTLIIIE